MAAIGVLENFGKRHGISMVYLGDAESIGKEQIERIDRRHPLHCVFVSTQRVV